MLQTPELKPYFFTPVAIKPERTGKLSRQRLLSGKCGKLRITIEVVTLTHIGSGKLIYRESDQAFIHKLARVDDVIALPGSGFKGMLRAVFEAVSESCIPLYPKPEDFEDIIPSNDANLTKCSINSLCPACSLFGCQSARGKLGFSSFRLESGDSASLTDEYTLPDLHSPTVTEYGRKFYRHSRHIILDDTGKEEYRDIPECIKPEREDRDIYECLKPGSKLTGEIIYQGLTPDEFGGLLFALGLGWGKRIYFKMGYAKPAYLGSVSLCVQQVKLPDRYNAEPDQNLEILAGNYYAAHRKNIQETVDTLSEAWAEIGDTSSWTRGKSGKLGY